MGSKKRLLINLSFLSPNNNDQTQIQTPQINNKKFRFVGLGIVAALDQTHDPYLSNRATVLSGSPKSTPIPIFGKSVGSNSEDRELSEVYTCVISHVGNNLVEKKEYFDGNLTSKSETSVAADKTGYWVTSGVFSASSPPPASESAAMKDVFGSEDFLSSCCLCKKKLHGLDIFMYRGEKAFCSVECRYKQISSDELKEKSRSRVKKTHEYSVSPCSGTTRFLAGMAAA